MFVGLTSVRVHAASPCPLPHFAAIKAPETRTNLVRETGNMRYLHTMLRVRNLDKALKFYQDALGLKEVRRVDNDKAKFTLVFLSADEDEGLVKQSRGRGAPLVELTYNWDEEKYGEDRYFGPRRWWGFFCGAPFFVISMRRALFCENSDMTRWMRIIGSENACQTIIRDN